MTVQQRASIAEMMIRESEFVDRLPTLGDFIATAIAIHQFIETGAPWNGLPQAEPEAVAESAEVMHMLADCLRGLYGQAGLSIPNHFDVATETARLAVALGKPPAKTVSKPRKAKK